MALLCASYYLGSVQRPSTGETYLPRLVLTVALMLFSFFFKFYLVISILESLAKSSPTVLSSIAHHTGPGWRRVRMLSQPATAMFLGPSQAFIGKPFLLLHCRG